MAGNNVIVASSISPQVLVSKQLGTTEVAAYTVPAAQSVKVAQATICNVTANMVPSLSLGASAAPISAPSISLGATATTGGTFAAATYYWKLTATTALGETTGSNEVSAAIAANGTQVINWTVVSNATGYKLYRGTAAGSENVLIATIGSGATVTYTDTGAAGTTASVPSSNSSAGGTFSAGTYYWKVTAKNASGESLGSNEITATLVANGTQAFSWAAVPYATNYNVYRGTSAGAEGTVISNVTSGTSYTDTGLVGGAQAIPTTSTFAAAVPIFVSIIQSGGVMGDGTHRVVNNYSLAANDTLSLKDILGSAMLGPGDAISAYAGAAGCADLVITGTVHA